MAFAKVFSAQPTLIRGRIISVEVDLSRGLHSFTVVGLPDQAVEESRDRVSAALKNTGFTPPKSKNEKITVSLAPADTKKEGPVFDVPIALAYLKASEDITFSPEEKIFIGELSLDGFLRPVRGVLSIVQEAKREGFKEIFLPEENAAEASLIEDISVYGAKTLRDIVLHLTKEKTLSPKERTPWGTHRERKDSDVDLRDIRGQEEAKRGLLIAATGGHNIAFFGPPGTGKTMLARALIGILPELSWDEALEVTSIHSLATLLKDPVITEPPFRSPHHTASYVSVIGGGTTPKPGEATLAHRGVLFLDEFPEFDKRVLESLREPLEDRVVRIARAKGMEEFPAHFLLIAAMNPCPCGNRGSKDKRCLCSPGDIARYKRKLSGPIVDRIDLWIEVGNIEYEKLSEAPAGHSSKEVRTFVREGRERAGKRLQAFGKKINSELSARHIEEVVPLTPELKKLLNESARRLGLSPRAYHKTIKVARTIADLGEKENVESEDILEALRYRPKTI